MRRPPPEPTTRIGADIGGTFTDIAFVDGGGRLTVHKVVSTPPDFGRAVAEVVERLHHEGALGSATDVIHGTTVTTNAILERRGARTALITTAGFRDVLELRPARSPELYDARYVPPPPPLVERRWRIEVDERVGPNGRVLVPIDEAEVRRTIAFLESEGIESVAVCLLHSFRNPAHERLIGRLLEETAAYTSLSVDLLSVIGEYERTSTTVVNAYIGPVVSRYLELAADLRRTAGIRRLQVMQSSGGLMSVARAARPGPDRGVRAGRWRDRRRPPGRGLGLARSDLPGHGRHDRQGQRSSRAGSRRSPASTKSARGSPCRARCLKVGAMP